MHQALLRPEFTHTLAARLQQGESINLTAPHGLGRRRTLIDLRSVLPQEMPVLHADIKFCLNDCAATFAGLATQAGMTDIHHPVHLIEGLASSPSKTLMILHNLDLLRNNPHDPLFDTTLLPFLKSVQHHPNIGLLVVCEDVYADWLLPCEALPLPPLDTL